MTTFRATTVALSFALLGTTATLAEAQQQGYGNQRPQLTYAQSDWQRREALRLQQERQARDALAQQQAAQRQLLQQQQAQRPMYGPGSQAAPYSNQYQMQLEQAARERLAQQQARNAPAIRQAPPPPPPPPPPPVDPTNGIVYRTLKPLEPYAQRGERYGVDAIACSAGGTWFATKVPTPLSAGVGCIGGIIARRHGP